ncbi:oxidoreductase [Streptomyces aidingensis]|uniref:Ferredoxin-NADP reductase n=1 Tax=Streptomyces aidingensis TaxID=910347 RepID=A0A1I1QBN1_9ACTN|nr:oxidoreductase [Streptomyces aidingensis]SFD16623.1 Ferredoxin-NADP reductase [Streptomyces aidingensis]
MDSTAQTSLRPAPSTGSRPVRTAPDTVPAAGPVRRDAAVRAAAAVALVPALVPAWYWSATDLPGGLFAPARFAAVTAGVTLLAQALLLSRVPVLERPFGLHRLVRLADLAGLASLALALAHAVLVLLAHGGSPLDLVSRTPGPLLTAAVLAAVALCWFLGRRLLRLLRPRRGPAADGRWWRGPLALLPLYCCLGLFLVLPQQLLRGASFLPSTAARAYWWTLWGLAAGALVLWRAALPLWRHRRHRLRVASVVAEGNGVLSVTIGGRRLDRLRAVPGQFLIWRFLQPETWRRATPYALSAVPDGRLLRITVLTRDGHNSGIRALEPGTPVWCTGPYGRLTARVRTRRRVALIGAGIGVAPLRALAEGLDHGPGEAVLLHRFTRHPLFKREFTALARRSGLDLIRLPGHRRAPGSWLGDRDDRDRALPADDLAALRTLVPDIADREVYVSGPPEWTAAVLRTLTDAGVPPRHTHTEPFHW